MHCSLSQRGKLSAAGVFGRHPGGILGAFGRHSGLIPPARRGITSVMLIYKIFRAHEWAALQSQGETLGAPIDLADGFVHFSTADQATETAAKHFAGAEGLILLALDGTAMGEALKWEVSRGNALFPHLYRALRLNDVLWAKPLPLIDGHHQFPDDMV